MSSAREDDTDFGILLHLAFARFKDALHAQLEREGFDDLGSSFGFVFRALDGAPLKLRDLAERLGITPQGALKIIDEMVAKKYVQRFADPADGRATLLSLAPRGEKAIAAAKRFHRRFEAELARRLGARRVADARTVLTALADGSDAPAAGARPF
ncbi:MAG: MarR family transcriptional regulator [Dongiaceae bacterium]